MTEICVLKIQKNRLEIKYRLKKKVCLCIFSINFMLSLITLTVGYYLCY